MENQHNLNNTIEGTLTNEEVPNMTQSPFSGCDSDTESSCDNELCEFEENSSSDEGLSTKSKHPVKGRRIVELALMAQRMICDFCRKDLLLRKIERETRRGFASILHIRCEECLLLNKIPTGQDHISGESGRTIFDVNTKIVLGARQNGLGYAHISKLMRTIEVPVMPATAFRRREREIGSIAKEIDSSGRKKARKRSLNIKNREKLPKLLPTNLRAGCYVHGESDRRINSVEQGFSNEAMEATVLALSEQQTNSTTDQCTSVKRKIEDDTDNPATEFFKRLQLADVKSNTKLEHIETCVANSDVGVKSEELDLDLHGME